MPASITLSTLSWSLPDGTLLFDTLDLTLGSECTGIVGRNGTGKTTLLRLIAGALVPSAGYVHVSGRAVLMQQDAGATPPGTIADLFDASPALALIDRAEAGRATGDELERADWTLPTRIEAALYRCGLSAPPEAPLAALSGGQRVRARLAAAIFAEPDVLLMDEPTNDLDQDGREAVIDLLRGWREAAVVVSHDRALLQEMDAIVELSPLGLVRYGGPYSAYAVRKGLDLEAARHDLATAERARDSAARRAQEATERKARRDSRGHKARSAGSQGKMALDAAKARAEASGGAHARLREARCEKMEKALSAAREKIEVLEPLHMALPATILPPGRTVLRMEGVTGGYDPAHPVIHDFSLTVTGPERIAITGPNGSGKTTLLALVMGMLAPWEGTVDLPVTHALLDQHMGLLDPVASIRENFLRLNPRTTENTCRAALARFRFRAADALRVVGTLSGGERLRAGLACTLGRETSPALLVLDEPTNHLDLDGLAALEEALTDYGGALLVVSHDETFLERLTLDRRVRLT